MRENMRVSTLVYLRACGCVYVGVHMCAYMRVCTCVCGCAHVFGHVCVCMHTQQLQLLTAKSIPSEDSEEMGGVFLKLPVDFEQSGYRACHYLSLAS